MGHQRVMLIRARPRTGAALQALELATAWAGLPGSSLLFFQGPGLAHAVHAQSSEFCPLAQASLELRVCQAGWRRLQQGALPELFRPGSLVQFWHAALGADQVRSFGAGCDD